MPGNVVRIRLEGSTYSARLIGPSGAKTDGLVIDGVYDEDRDVHEFLVEVSGPYELYVDPTGGTSYSLDTAWGKDGGKVLLGRDAQTHFAGHGNNSAGTIMPEETTFVEDFDFDV